MLISARMPHAANTSSQFGSNSSGRLSVRRSAARLHPHTRVWPTRLPVSPGPRRGQGGEKVVADDGVQSHQHALNSEDAPRPVPQHELQRPSSESAFSACTNRAERIDGPIVKGSQETTSVAPQGGPFPRLIRYLHRVGVRVKVR